MLISLKNNIAFLAMTKTGSTSIEAATAPLCDIVFTHDPRVKHMQYRRFDRFLRPYLKTLGHEEVETTCLFREPLDWLGSWYRYRRRDALVGHRNSTANLTFDEFIQDYLSDEPSAFSQVGRQSNFVMNKSREIGIDHLFRFDQFENFSEFLSNRFGRAIKFDRLNSSATQKMDVSIPTLDRLKDELALDFEIYDSL